MKPTDAHWTCPNHPLAGPGVSGRAVAPLCHRPGCDYKTTMTMVHSFGCDGTHDVGDCNRLAVPATPRPLTDLIGLDPNFTGGLSAEEHLRRQRCGECDEAVKERDAARAELARAQAVLRDADAWIERVGMAAEAVIVMATDKTPGLALMADLALWNDRRRAVLADVSAPAQVQP